MMNTTTKVATRLAAVVLAAAFIGGSSAHASDSVGGFVGGFTSSFTAVFTLDGCAASNTSKTNCATSMAAQSGTATNLPCVANYAWVQRQTEQNEGVCEMGNGLGSPGTVPISERNAGCGEFVWSETGTSSLWMTDAQNIRWHVTQLYMDATGHQWAEDGRLNSGVDVWNLRSDAHMTSSSQDSYIVMQHGTTTVIASVYGTVTAQGNCSMNMASRTYQVNGVAYGEMFNR